jgi:hypothetical protein
MKRAKRRRFGPGLYFTLETNSLATVRSSDWSGRRQARSSGDTEREDGDTGTGRRFERKKSSFSLVHRVVRGESQSMWQSGAGDLN